MIGRSLLNLFSFKISCVINVPLKKTLYIVNGEGLFNASSLDDFKQAITLDENMVDAHYSLGMVLKALGRKEEAIAAFQKVVDLVTPDVGSGNVSADMLRKLALGHKNELTQGDWNLEKEIWKHID